MKMLFLQSINAIEKLKLKNFFAFFSMKLCCVVLCYVKHVRLKLSKCAPSFICRAD